MRPVRRYPRAWIMRRGEDQMEEVFDVCLHSSFVIYFDAKRNERTAPWATISEVIEYAEDRKPKEAKEEHATN